MKRVRLRFKVEESIDYIDVLIRASEKDEDVSELVRRIKPSDSRQLTVLDQYDRSCVIDENEIIYVTSDAKNVRIVTAKETYRARQSMQNMESLLNERVFLRVSRFEIVNLTKVVKYDFTVAGTLRIEFTDGNETWASRRYIPLIKEKLSGEEGYLC